MASPNAVISPGGCSGSGRSTPLGLPVVPEEAVVQLMPEITPCDEVAEELKAFCRGNLAHLKCPRTVDFEAELPRLPTGKLYKTPLRERYWRGHQSRIL